MSAHRQSSPGFGRWIRENRLLKGYSQGYVVDSVLGMSQASLSLIETSGYIPKQSQLVDLCVFLGLPLDEAHRYIAQGSLVAILRQRCAVSQQYFCRMMQQCANQPSGAHVCVIRDSQQPYDSMRDRLFSKLLSLHDRLQVSILFTHANPVFERSFRRFHGMICKKASAAQRVKGYICMQGSAEPDWPPMFQPICLVITSNNYAVVSSTYVPEILEENPPALEVGLQLTWEGETEFGKSVTNYIGFLRALQPDGERWRQINLR